jgi:KaiC/GvpD/RAD55 family RecA-like ATPase
MRKCKTGIPGFDKLVRGGIPRGATILLCGTPGTAKSIFSLQQLYNGALNYKEKGLYVSFEQDKQALISQGKMFGWDIPSLEKEELVHFMCMPVKDINSKTCTEIIDYVKKNKIKRLVIDSLSTLSIVAPVYAAISDLFLKELVTRDNIFSPSLSEDFLLKRFIYHFMDDLQKLPVTTILISEIGSDSKFLSRDTVSEFLSDGIIQMFFESMGGEYSRSLLVRKMRHVNNDEDIHPVEIGKEGLVVHDLK